tara:strand:+ start:1308 stop:1811 length:504 start_codon:yes stop_codon:yes gene_type:complete
MIIWFLGISGSGKTTIAKKLKYLLDKKNKVVLLDGDELRNVWSDNLGYAIESREKNAERIFKLVKLLHKQNCHIIVSVLSNFPKWLKKNKKTFKKDYTEIFLDIPLELAIKRKQNVYKLQKNIVGIDIPFNRPENPDIIISEKFLDDPFEALNIIIKYLKKNGQLQI